jgi:hypothetical protein
MRQPHSRLRFTDKRTQRSLFAFCITLVLALTTIFAQMETPAQDSPTVTPISPESPLLSSTLLPTSVPSPILPEMTDMATPLFYSPTVPPVFPTASNPAVIGRGEEIQGEISPEHPTIFFNYEGNAGEIVVFQLISPPLMPTFFFDVNFHSPEMPFEPLPSDEDGNLVLTSTRVLSETRTYTIRIDSANPYGTPHPFILRRLVPDIEPLNFDGPQQGALGLAQPIAVYSFDAEVSTFISLTTQALYPTSLEIVYLSERQNESEGLVSGGFTPGYGYGVSNIDFYQIPRTGRYAVIVRQALHLGGDVRSQTEPFLINLRKVNPIEMAYGDMIEGELTAENTALFYTFHGQYGDVVTASVDTDGSPDTLLTLYGPGRLELVSDDDSNGGLDPEIYRLPLQQEWTDISGGDNRFFLRVRTIQVEDYGSFTLSLQNTAQELTEEPLRWRWNNKGLINTFYHEGVGGETLHLTLRVLRGANTPNISLTQGREQLLSLAATSLEQVEAVFTLPRDGRLLLTLDSSGRFLETEITLTRVQRTP